jgi:hypothetical protein
MVSIDDLFDKWAKEEETKLSRRKINKKEEAGAKRTYLHFDLRRPKSSLFSLKNEFIDPNKISSHGYWPFLKMTIKTPRIRDVKESSIGKFKNRKRRKETKDRDVYYASHYDALVYSWYSFLLNNYYEDELRSLGINNCVIAYRKIPTNVTGKRNKSSINFAFEVFNFIKNKGECAVIVSDITKFFDSLDHLILKKEWIRVIGLGENQKLPKDHYSVYKNLTKFKFVDAQEVFDKANIKFKKIVDKEDKYNIKVFKAPFRNGERIVKICDNRQDFLNLIVKGGLIKGNQNKNALTGSKRRGQTCGIMQGAPISATLANVYMLNFDKEINDYVEKNGGLYRRYSDDLIIVCGVNDYQDAAKLMYEKIRNYELEINPKKTCITLFLKDHKGLIRGFDEKYLKPENKNNALLLYKNMQYLGLEFNGKNVFLRSSSIAKYYRKMKSKIRKSVNMSFGKRSKTKNNNNRVFTKILFKKYLHKGRRSFISYAYRAIDIGLKIFGTDAIKKQLSKRQAIMSDEINRRVVMRKRRRS